MTPGKVGWRPWRRQSTDNKQPRGEQHKGESSDSFAQPKLALLPPDLLKLRVGLEKHKRMSLTVASNIRLGDRAALLGPLSLMLWAHAEQHFLGSNTLRDGIVSAAKWAFDGSQGMSFRRERYVQLETAIGVQLFADSAASAKALEERSQNGSTVSGKSSHLIDAGACIARAGGPPSSLRRICSWVVDYSCLTVGKGALALMAAGSATTRTLLALVSPSISVICWGTRDLWLSSAGLQSPGRYIVGQQVIALAASSTNPDEEVWATITLNTAFAAAVRLLLPSWGVAVKAARKNLQHGKGAVRVASRLLMPVQLLGGGLLVFCAVSPAWSLAFDARGNVWMDKIARTQVLQM